MLCSLTLAAALGALSPAGPGFDCRKASAPDEKLICAEPELAGLDRRLSVLWSWEVAGLQDEKGRASRREVQRAWLERRTACAGGAGAPAGRAEQVACVRSAYQARIAELERDVGPVPDAILVIRRDHPAQKKRCDEVDVSWPELQSTTLSGAAAFNAHFAEKPHPPECVDKNDPRGDTAPGWYNRSSSLLWRSGRFVTLARSEDEYTAGAAHPNHDATLVTFDLVQGRPVGPDEVLTADPGLRMILLGVLARRLSPEGEVDAKALSESAFTPGHWAFTGEGARVHFSPYELAGYAQGDFEAAFTWEELRPYLRPGSPLPEGRPRSP
jgi:uncharacterized protein